MQVGDSVQFGDISGPVVKIGFRTTHVLRKYDGHVVQIPNVLLASKVCHDALLTELVDGQVLRHKQSLQPLQPCELAVTP